MDRATLEKSLDKLIDEMFMKKSDQPGMPEPKKTEGNPQTPELAEKVKTADSGEKPAEGEEEKDGTRGRPKDPSNMSARSADGASSLDYPSSVSSEAAVPAHETTVAKSEKIEISKEDFEILQKAKAAKDEAAKEEVLKKARAEQATLIKSIVIEATKEIREDNTKLSKSLSETQKSLGETQELLKKALSKPKPRQSVSSVAVLEKSFGGNAPEDKKGQETFSKSDMLDAAERLVKAKKLPVEAAIELEDTGFVYNPRYRALLEQELKNPTK
jgi:hypothetical protein